MVLPRHSWRVSGTGKPAPSIAAAAPLHRLNEEQNSRTARNQPSGAKAATAGHLRRLVPPTLSARVQLTNVRGQDKKEIPKEYRRGNQSPYEKRRLDEIPDTGRIPLTLACAPTSSRARRERPGEGRATPAMLNNPRETIPSAWTTRSNCGLGERGEPNGYHDLKDHTPARRVHR